MPFLLPHIMLSLLAGALAIAGLNLAFPVEIARSINGVPFAALLANLPGTAGTARGLPVLTICRIELTRARALVVRAAAHGIVAAGAFGDGVTGSRARVVLAFNAVAAVLSLPQVIRLLKWGTGAS
jgi:putative effector of murein hydrolase